MLSAKQIIEHGYHHIKSNVDCDFCYSPKGRMFKKIDYSLKDINPNYFCQKCASENIERWNEASWADK